jgi:KaiC/GvpD/RAD55 family RecA-like ATPase
VLKDEMSFAIRYGARDFKRDFAAAVYQIFLVTIEASENARTDRTENNTVLDEEKFYQSLKKEVLQLINTTPDDKALLEKYLMAAISLLYMYDSTLLVQSVQKIREKDSYWETKE